MSDNAWRNGLVDERVDHPDGTETQAVFSACRTWRYLLRHTWQPQRTPMLFLMLHPPTDDTLAADRTIRQCAMFAARYGYGGVSVANLLALRSDDQETLLRHPDPSGPDNLRILTTLALRDPGRIVVAAWGNHNPRLGIYAEQTLDLFTERGHTVHRIGALNAAGNPRHPGRAGAGLQLEVHAPGRPILDRDPLAALRVPEGLQPCHAAGMCPRLVTAGVRYCCGPCGDGWEATPRHEPEHTQACDARWTERRPAAAVPS